MIDRLDRLVADLRERRPVRFILGYLVGAWIAVQVVGFFVEQGYVSRTLLDVVLYLVAVFLLVMLVLVWYHGEAGQQRVQRPEAVLVGGLLLAAAGGASWIAVRGSGVDPGTPGATYDLGDNSIAVLPFENSVLAPDFAWLERGIPDLIATDLSQFDTLRVVSGQRLFDLLRQMGVEDSRTVPRDLQERVTRSAGARYMLTGSVIGRPEDLQLIAQLVDTDTGEIRASARARGSDVFALVDEVSAALSSDLLGREVLTSNAPVAQLTTNNIEAYRQFDAGRDALWQHLTTEAREHFERAIALDSTFALAHFQLAGLLFRGGDFGTATGHLQAASRHLGSASERDRLSVGAMVDLIYGNVEEGERKFAELITKYPDEKDARLMYAMFLSGQLGRPGEAEGVLKDVLALDPFYGEAWNALAYHHARRGDFEAADTLIQRYVELEPGRPNPLDSRGEILEMAGRYEEARSYYRQALELRADFAVALAHLIRTYVHEGRFDEARVELVAYKASESPDTRYWAWWLTADAHVWEGDIETGLATYDSLVVVAASSGRPDLYAQSLDCLVRTLILLERYERADRVADSLRAARGEDGVTTAARLHRLGSQRDLAAMERVRTAVSGGVAGAPAAFARAAEVGRTVLIEYYRGAYSRVVELLAEFDRESTVPMGQLGFPGIRSALEVGDAAAARVGVDRMMFTVIASGFRSGPLEMRYQTYFRGRIAELDGDDAGAREAYDALIHDWDPALDVVPIFADVRSRRAALADRP